MCSNWNGKEYRSRIVVTGMVRNTGAECAVTGMVKNTGAECVVTGMVKNTGA